MPLVFGPFLCLNIGDTLHFLITHTMGTPDSGRENLAADIKDKARIDTPEEPGQGTKAIELGQKLVAGAEPGWIDRGTANKTDTSGVPDGKVRIFKKGNINCDVSLDSQDRITDVTIRDEGSKKGDPWSARRYDAAGNVRLRERMTFNENGKLLEQQSEQVLDNSSKIFQHQRNEWKGGRLAHNEVRTARYGADNNPVHIETSTQDLDPSDTERSPTTRSTRLEQWFENGALARSQLDTFGRDGQNGTRETENRLTGIRTVTDARGRTQEFPM